MSDNSSNPLDGLPTPQKAAKPSPLKSDPGHQPQQGERWWLQNSIKPEGEEPEKPESVEEPEQSEQEAATETPAGALSTDEHSETTPAVDERDDDFDNEALSGSSKLPMVVGFIIVIGVIAAFLLSGGEA
jgi:hypothetical protein